MKKYCVLCLLLVLNCLGGCSDFGICPPSFAPPDGRGEVDIRLDFKSGKLLKGPVQIEMFSKEKRILYCRSIDARLRLECSGEIYRELSSSRIEQHHALSGSHTGKFFTVSIIEEVFYMKMRLKIYDGNSLFFDYFFDFSNANSRDFFRATLTSVDCSTPIGYLGQVRMVLENAP